MKIKPRLDTRRTVRVEDNFAVAILYRNKAIPASSINISISGLLCRVPSLLPVFSEVCLTMYLPHMVHVQSAQVMKGSNKTPVQVCCRGVVLRCIRCEDEKEGYSTAIYFLELDDASRKHLKRYIEKLTPSSMVEG